mmetsp:Transcript_23235/g.32123  ORF Transcript_23235/g.32123 Transcript_23235/m.32123 type:complete len:754 (-) Transcript_23235:170-2431(-)|eukprot:CAMPEP_0196581498 /NCGR_PEP_ID=MMETSP1081-20130531/33999_1 /TAXON_ID=36882 /ORGANISM="Pyramimonas amylifera, Strain CCMP720" /LENGTH=753 /DNA_ID=CAMNT_0041901751 /DNA_START=210 /DNA_END=2474 /DNA_ORIENTATION=+
MRRSHLSILILTVFLSFGGFDFVSTARFGGKWLCETLKTAIENNATYKDTQIDCDVNALPGGHLIELFEGTHAGADYSICSSYILIPGENMWSREARGFLYLFALLYFFLGIAIVADVFMNAIEVITSKTVEVERVDENGKVEMVSEKFWNDTIANLSLMALGSSAPEILLAVIGVVFTLGEEADALGPGTIVGSASFNLLFITAICVVSPSPNSTRVNQYGVFLITSFFAVEAYIWLLFILEFSSPEVVDIWEAVVTLLHFPLLLIVSYGQDRNWSFGMGVAVSPHHEGEEKENRFDNSYLKFRRNAVRYITAGPRVMWKGADNHTHLPTDQPKVQRTSDIKLITSDPYVILKMGKDKVFKTPWIKKDLNPIWNETFTFEGVKLDESLAIEVFDHDEISADDFMGQAQVSLVQLTPGVGIDTWVQLASKANMIGGRGEIHFVLTVNEQTVEKEPSGLFSLQVQVVEGKDLVGLDKQSNKYIEAMTEGMGKNIRSMKNKMANNKETWKAMKEAWFYQFKDALMPRGEYDEQGVEQDPSNMDLFMHFMTVFWKVMFACIPPADFYGGWLAFNIALIFIGGVTAVVGELAALFGCVVGLKDAVTAITFVALGTSLPDTFASRVAAMQEEHADAAIGNVTGSNAVNVFLGIGIPWTIAAVYGDSIDTPFVSRSCGFGLNVFVYVVCALMCLILLRLRRQFCGGELGGNPQTAKLHGLGLVILWFVYIIVSSLRAYKDIGDLWTINSVAVSKPNSCP